MVFEKNLLKGKVAIVTGGGTGIGKEIAKHFLELGAKVAIAGRKKEPLEKTEKEFKGKELMVLQTDIRDPEQANNLVRQTVKRWGKLDILINNAGGQFIAPVEKISNNAFDAVVKTNLYGTFYMCRAAGEAMKKNGGKIVNVVHIYALRAAPGLVHSGAARAGVVNLTKSLAVEWAKHGINVNAIAPGITETEGLKTEMIYDKKTLQELKDTIPLHRYASPKEIAGVVTFLVSPAADYITGQTLVVDGGQILGNWPDFTRL